jgi:HEAT repeat protein
LRPYGLKAINRLLDYKSGRVSVDKDINVRDAHENISEALIEIGKLHSDYVIDLFDKELDNPKSKDLQTLTNIVGKLGNNRALEYLDKGLTYQNEGIRESCISALFKLDGPTKADAYVRALDDISESVQLAGIRGLRMVGDKKAITKLDRYNNSDNNLLKTEARRAIEDINRRDKIKTAANTGFV